MSFDDFKHKVLDFADRVKADPKKQLAVVFVVGVVVGLVFAKLA